MKIRFISRVVSVLFIILIIGCFRLQVIGHKKYLELSRNNRVRLLSLESPRGNIFDKNGVLIVSNRPSFDVVVMPQELENSIATLSRLGGILGIPPSEIFRNVEKDFTAPFAPILVKADIPKEKAIIIEEEAFRLPGIVVKIVPRREYKFGIEGSHVLGYIGETDKGDLERLKGYGYQIKDTIGKTGLEKSYDTYLRGEEGGMQLEINNRGYLVRPLGRKEAVQGKDLHLTIDIRLQDLIEKLFVDKTGACVVMNPYSGEVLALVSRPAFDPNIFAAKGNKKQLSYILNDSGRPMLNRAIAGLYPPGSVFKPVVAIAALDKEKMSGTDNLSCAGKYTLGNAVFRCWDEEGHGSQRIEEGLKNSCNVFFYQAGRLVGVDDIAAYASKFGFGSPTGIDLPDESPGLVPNKLWKRIARKESWFEGDTVNYSIGQGYLLVTPLQVARMISAIANGGDLVQPYIVKKIDNVEISSGRIRHIGISKEALAIVKEGLRRVIEDETGTGRRAKVEGLSIAGKTGTAQNPNGTSHAWFCGFSPVQKPKVAIVVFIEHGGKGGMEASALAGKIFQEAQVLKLL